jgi:hypothetical protein
LGVTVVVPVIVFPGRARVNSRSLPAMAVVCPTSTRIPVIHRRTVVPATTEQHAVAVVAAIVGDTIPV